MANFIDIHAHNPRNEGIEIGNFRLGIDSKQPEIPFSAGIHPWDCEVVSAKFDNLLSALKTSPCIAIGEIGLDKACGVDFELQKRCFEAQLSIAEKRELPVVIHCVRAINECLATLQKHKLKSVVFHGFIGSAEMAKSIVSKGYYISFGYPTLASPKTFAALAEVPLERLFLESDTSSTPIEELYNKVAQRRSIDTEILQEIIENNYNTIF